MNPCTSVDPIPSTIPTFSHRRPVISWFQDGNDARWSTYNGDTAEHPRIGEFNAAGTKIVTGSQFRGTTSSGGIWYSGQNYPEEYRNTFFLADYGRTWIRNVVFDDNNEPLAVREFDDDAGGVVSMAVDPDSGDVYYITWTAFVNRLEYAPNGNQAPTAFATSDTNYGTTPLTIQFSSDASSDPEDDPLTYQWDFADGSPTSNEANPQHTFTSSDSAITNFAVTLTVSDDAGGSSEDTLLVSLNNSPPTISNVVPADGTLYSVTEGTTYSLSATYSDAESPNQQLACEWQTVLHHDTHVHSDPIDNQCTTSTEISPLGCGVETFSYYIHLKITDPNGLEATHTSILRPNCSGQANLPVITLNGDNPQVITTGSAYMELGAIARDHAGGDLTASIVIDSSAVRTGTAGSYSVSYNVIDEWGNAAQTAIRTVTIQDSPSSPPPRTTSSGSGVTGMFGLLFLFSLLLRRNLRVGEFHIGRQP
jgi:PKD repeat protein